MQQIQEATREVLWGLQSSKEKNGLSNSSKAMREKGNLQRSKLNLSTGIGEEGPRSTSSRVELAVHQAQARQCVQEKWNLHGPNHLLYFTHLADPQQSHLLCGVGQPYRSQRHLVAERYHLAASQSLAGEICTPNIKIECVGRGEHT